MMNKESSANYEDRIEFVIALMTRDYTKACDIGYRLLKRDKDDIHVATALNILKYKKQHEMKVRRRPSFIDNPIETDNECEASDITDGDDIDSVDDNVDVCINPRIANKTTSRKEFQIPSNSDKSKTGFDFKYKMHRVIPIRINKVKSDK